MYTHIKRLITCFFVLLITSINMAHAEKTCQQKKNEESQQCEKDYQTYLYKHRQGLAQVKTERQQYQTAIKECT